MSEYVKSTNFASKDSLASGNPLKIVKGTEIDTEFNNIATAVATKADLNSPALIGTPTAPTAASGTNTTQVATTAFARDVALNSPALTGTPTAPTASAGDNSTKIATTAYVDNAVILPSSGVTAGTYGGSNASPVVTVNSKGIVTSASTVVIAPVGSVITFAGNSAPSGYLECNGSAVSRTTYSALFAVIGTTFGVGNGSTTFNLPDLRGQFVRGWDNGRGLDSGRSFGSDQQATGHSTGGRADQPLQDYENAYSTTSHTNGPTSYQYNQSYTFARSRPTNVALMFCIKT